MFTYANEAYQYIYIYIIRGADIPVRGSPFRASPVSSRLHKGCRGSPCSSRRLADPSSLSRPGLRTQGPSAAAPSLSGPSGQLGEEQTLLRAEDLFSRYGNRLGRHVRAAYERARAVTANLPSSVRGQECGSTETISEAPGAYGIRSRSNVARLASYETASALASRSSPEVGMATRHAPSPSDCRQTFTPWTNLSFLWAGVPIERVSWHVVVSTDASIMG